MTPVGRPHLIFDLDGTLLDSSVGILASLRHTLDAHGHSSEGLGAQLIGPPLDAMLAQLTGAQGPVLAALSATFRAHYDAHGWRRTRPFPGVLALLQRCHQQGQRLFIVTNKRREISLRLLDHLNLAPLLDSVHTLDTVQPPWQNKGLVVQDLLITQGLDPAMTLLVGDMPSDAKAAAQCGVRFVGVNWGYGHWDPPPKRFAHDLDALEGLLQ